MADFDNNMELLGWDDEISSESSFELLPDGDYDFTVVNFERDRYAGGEKMPPCNVAKITCRVVSPTTGTNIDTIVSLFMLKRVEWKLSEFFTCIGQKKKGEPLKMNWNAVMGAKGRLRMGTRTYKNSTYNDIKKFLEPTTVESNEELPFGGGF